MAKIITWIRNNKLLFTLTLGFLSLLALLFLLVIFFVIFLRAATGSSYRSSSYTDSYSVGSMPSAGMALPNFSKSYSTSPEYSAAGDVSNTNRKVITNSYLSTLVKDVNTSIRQIEEQTNAINGFVVNKTFTKPQEAASGSITVRIPADKINGFIDFVQNNSVKLVSINISGNDITDQFSDLQAKLDILNKNKERYVQIMERAETVDEILRVQTQIFALQDQIDRIQGQLKYMEGASSTSLVSVNLSTDELALPYSPDGAWRPGVVFKQATRSLVLTLRGLGNIGIWLAVYAVIWVPVLIVLVIIKKWVFKKIKTLLDKS